MRQAGYLAAAGLYALEHHIHRLREDHRRARVLGEALASLPCTTELRPVETNILIFDLKPPWTAASFLAALGKKHIRAAAFGPQTVRFVTHLDFTDAMLERVLEALQELN